jgi:uncharacterized protein (TIGR03067 family)
MGLLLAILANGSHSPKEYDLGATQLTGIEGTWVHVSTELNGAPVQMDHYTLIYRNGKVLEISKSGTCIGTYTIYDQVKPARMEVVPDNGWNKGRVLRSIYQVDNNTLKSASLLGSLAYPDSFDEGGLFFCVATFKRK